MVWFPLFSSANTSNSYTVLDSRNSAGTLSLFTDAGTCTSSVGRENPWGSSWTSFVMITSYPVMLTGLVNGLGDVIPADFQVVERQRVLRGSLGVFGDLGRSNRRGRRNVVPEPGTADQGR